MAVQVVNLPTFIEEGEHVTETEVVDLPGLGAVTVTVKTADEEGKPPGMPEIVIA